MRFGRKRSGPDADTDASTELEEPGQEEAQQGPVVGPFDADADDLDLEAALESEELVDLGSLLLPTVAGLDLQLQVDETSGEVVAVLMGNEEGALEVRAFAAARNGDLWSDARREIAADTARRGGTATEQDGPVGVELFCQVPVTTPDGQSAVQPSRVLGHNGPRWFLRASLLGRPAIEQEAEGPFVEAFRRIVVRRGAEAMPPGEALPVHLPPQAQRMA